MALVKIVYASMTGNTEEIADIVGNKFEELGHTVEVDECTTVDITAIHPKSPIVITNAKAIALATSISVFI